MGCGASKTLAAEPTTLADDTGTSALDESNNAYTTPHPPVAAAESMDPEPEPEHEAVPAPVSAPLLVQAPPSDRRDVVTETAVKVAIAVRPLLRTGVEKGCADIARVMVPNEIQMPQGLHAGSVPVFDKAGEMMVDDGMRRFDFDRVLKVDSSAVSKQLFQLAVPCVERFCQGFNGCVLAYGQTGSGKTFTMGTAAAESEFHAKQPRGVVPQTMRLLFSYLQNAMESYNITLKVQYVEVYKDAIFDLLSPDGGMAKLDIHERATGEIFVEGVTEMDIESPDQIAELLATGNANRTVAEHNMNKESSRSHAILTLCMDQRIKLEASLIIPRDQHFLRSKLNLVDLAGSERVLETGATGDRFKEGVAINQGLHELGNVINALASGKAKQFVPYRNAKLTRLLSDSLGGNCETLFIACVSPADRNFEATLGTLRYATRVRAIKNKLKQNRMSKEEELAYLRGLVRQLQNEADKYKAFSAQLRAQLAEVGVENVPEEPEQDDTSTADANVDAAGGDTLPVKDKMSNGKHGSAGVLGTSSMVLSKTDGVTSDGPRRRGSRLPPPPAGNGGWRK